MGRWRQPESSLINSPVSPEASASFGFVEMSGDSEAQAAIAALNGTQLGGRTLTVNEARPQEPRSGGGGRGGFGGGRH